MKKLLFISLLGLVSMGNIFSHVPTQSIFGDSVHTVEPVNQEKVSAINELFDPCFTKHYLYVALDHLWYRNQLNEKSIIASINAYRKKELDPITSLDKSAFIEFSKDYKNQLAKEIIGMMKYLIIECEGDEQRDQVLLLLASCFSYFSLVAAKVSKELSMDALSSRNILFIEIAQGISLAFGVYALTDLAYYYFNIRKREAEMRKIEKLIEAIEKME